jgi:hypothetical protein
MTIESSVWKSKPPGATDAPIKLGGKESFEKLKAWAKNRIDEMSANLL